RVLDCRGTNALKPNGGLADLTSLKGMNLGGLTELDLRDTKVNDAGMVYFKDSKNLRRLDLIKQQVRDSGMVDFTDWQDLKYLGLGYSAVGDSGRMHFKDCKELTGLLLFGTKLNDAGLAHLKDCKALTRLILAETKVSDAGLARFKGVPLKQLWIQNTSITDLTPLQGMPLEEIRLTPKNITKGLDILRDMKSLKTIGIEHNQFWPAAEFWQRYDKGEFK